MARWTPDPSFYPSPRLAAKAPAETLAYVATFAPKRDVPDAIAVVDADPSSATYSKIVGQVDMTAVGDELHHHGWNARSSRIYIIDTKPDPRRPTIAKVIEPEEVIERTGYSRPHTVHCGPEGIYVSALGNAPATGLAASSSWTPKPSRCSAAGKLTVGRKLSRTMPGGISATTRW